MAPTRRHDAVERVIPTSTRRQFVSVVVVTAAVGALADSATADPTLPAPATVIEPGARSMAAELVIGEGSALPVLSADLLRVRTLPFTLCQQVRLVDPGPFRALLDYDDRLFSPGPSAVVSSGDRYEASATTVAAVDPGTRSRVAFDVPDVFDGATQAAVELSLPLTVRDRYPSEGMDAPMPLTLTLVDPSGAEIARREWAPGEPVPVSAWGAAVSATWSSTGVVDGASTGATRYRYPTAVQCSSVGPGPIPAGSSLTLELDGRIVGSCEVVRIEGIETVAPTLSIAPEAPESDPVALVAEQQAPPPWPADAFTMTSESREGLLRTIVTVGREVPAGTGIAIEFAVAEAAEHPTITSVVYAAATLTGPAGDGHWQRATGAYTTTDLTDSGAPQVPDVAQGRI